MKTGKLTMIEQNPIEAKSARMIHLNFKSVEKAIRIRLKKGETIENSPELAKMINRLYNV